nr:MAG TPA_asm: hypothetical protein [Caudoviricetes sp.]
MNRDVKIMQDFKDFISKYKIPIAFIIIVLIFSIVVGMMFKKILDLQSDLDSKPVIMTPEQATNPNYLQNKENMNRTDAEKTTVIIEKAQQGQIQPSSTIVIQAPTPEKATEVVKEKIEQKDPTLPPEALEKTDRTIIAEQPENKDYQVGVYKINLSKRWSIGTGVGQLDNKTYVPIAVERLYKNNRSIEIQGNFDLDKKKINGVQVMHKWYF